MKKANHKFNCDFKETIMKKIKKKIIKLKMKKKIKKRIIKLKIMKKLKEDNK